MFSFANAAYIGLVDNEYFKLTVKEEHGPDELLCFVVEGGYIQAWSIASFANFWLSIIIIMTILKKSHIAPDKLHECSTITEAISRCVLQKLLPTISIKRLLSLEICSQTQKKAKAVCLTLGFNSGKSCNCRLYVRLRSENYTCLFQNLLY